MNLPADNEGYHSKAYWDERYQKEGVEGSFDWFKTYADIAIYLDQYIPSKEGKIVMLGCGNSTLSKDMYESGYKQIVNLDYSSIVISQMAKKYSDTSMTWIEGDIQDLPLESHSFDVAIDKGTMDALMTLKGDLWNPPPEVTEACKKEIDEVIRVLKPTGVFIYLTFGQPHFRKQHLVRPGWKLEIVELGTAFHYYLYILRKEVLEVGEGI